MCVIPGRTREAREGKGIHQARVCAPTRSLRAADATIVGAVSKGPPDE